jgi:hypothetical protein
MSVQYRRASCSCHKCKGKLVSFTTRKRHRENEEDGSVSASEAKDTETIFAPAFKPLSGAVNDILKVLLPESQPFIISEENEHEEDSSNCDVRSNHGQFLNTSSSEEEAEAPQQDSVLNDEDDFNEYEAIQQTCASLGMRFAFWFAPLYPNASVTVFQAAQAILSYCWTEGLSRSASKRLFSMIALLLPKPHSLPTYSKAKTASDRFGGPLAQYTSYHLCDKGCFIFDHGSTERKCPECGEPRYQKTPNGSWIPRRVGCCLPLFLFFALTFCDGS